VENLLFPSLKAAQGPLLVTGHTGFKGAWLILLLKELHIPVVGYSLAPEVNSLYDRAELAGAIPEIYADIRDAERLREFLHLHRPSNILHMAAQPLVLKSYKNPFETFSINVMGTASVLESTLHSESIRSVAVVTTDKVYENKNLNRKFVEGDSLAGKDPYSASKVGTESVVSAWNQISKIQSGPKIFSLRGGNVIGGGDFAEDRLLPDLVRTHMSKQKLTIRNPSSTRPWQHVLDLLWGYLLALDKSQNHDIAPAYNFGPMEKSLTVSSVAKIFSEGWDGLEDSLILNQENGDQRESKFLDLDPNLARLDLNWHPAWSQIEAIEKTSNWWRSLLNEKLSAQDASIADIQSFIQIKMNTHESF